MHRLARWRGTPYKEAFYTLLLCGFLEYMTSYYLEVTKGMRWWLIAVALAVALVVWHFGISPVWFLIAGAVVGACVVARRGGEQC